MTSSVDNVAAIVALTAPPMVTTEDAHRRGSRCVRSVATRRRATAEASSSSEGGPPSFGKLPLTWNGSRGLPFRVISRLCRAGAASRPAGLHRRSECLKYALSGVVRGLFLSFEPNQSRFTTMLGAAHQGRVGITYRLNGGDIIARRAPGSVIFAPHDAHAD